MAGTRDAVCFLSLIRLALPYVYVDHASGVQQTESLQATAGLQWPEFGSGRLLRLFMQLSTPVASTS
jgi:hypothetical protein